MRMRRRAATPLLLLLASAAEVAMATEEPDYRVLETRDGFEVRLCEPRIVAQTTAGGAFGPGGNEGFRRVDAFLFGGNDGSRSIAMTAPAAREKGGERWTVSFVMPSGQTFATHPKPADPPRTPWSLRKYEFLVPIGQE